MSREILSSDRIISTGSDSDSYNVMFATITKLDDAVLILLSFNLSNIIPGHLTGAGWCRGIELPLVFDLVSHGPDFCHTVKFDAFLFLVRSILFERSKATKKCPVPFWCMFTWS